MGVKLYPSNHSHKWMQDGGWKIGTILCFLPGENSPPSCVDLYIMIAADGFYVVKHGDLHEAD